MKCGLRVRVRVMCVVQYVGSGVLSRQVSRCARHDTALTELLV